ncbi:MAG: YfiR family protein [Gammaproteobacteria bacterium]|nr:YfiR family protein [Gammaproteobacteria bacterium]
MTSLPDALRTLLGCSQGMVRLWPLPGLLLALCLSAAGHAKNISEGQVRAVYLFNFALFVTWPEHAFTDARQPFRFCVMGNRRLTQLLDETSSGERVKGRHILVVPVTPAADLEQCHLLYLDRSLGYAWGSVLHSLAEVPVLTVGNHEDFVAEGGMIGLLRRGRRIRPLIDPAGARRAGIRISSKLLRLADVVTGVGDEGK